MIEQGGLPTFSYKYKSQSKTNINKKVKSDKQNLKNKKTRFVSTDMTKVNIADVLSFIKQDTKQDDMLTEFQNLDIVNQL
jgi:homospermidine synthase